MPKAANKADNRTMTAVRLPPEDLAEIRRRAKERNLTLTEYLRQSALGILPPDENEIEPRLDALEREVARLGKALFGG